MVDPSSRSPSPASPPPPPAGPPPAARPRPAVAAAGAPPAGAATPPVISDAVREALATVLPALPPHLGGDAPPWLLSAWDEPVWRIRCLNPAAMPHQKRVRWLAVGRDGGHLCPEADRALITTLKLTLWLAGTQGWNGTPLRDASVVLYGTLLVVIGRQLRALGHERFDSLDSDAMAKLLAALFTRRGNRGSHRLAPHIRRHYLFALGLLHRFYNQGAIPDGLRHDPVPIAADTVDDLLRSDSLDGRREPRKGRTPRLPEPVARRLITTAIHFVEDLAEPILTLQERWCALEAAMGGRRKRAYVRAQLRAFLWPERRNASPAHIATIEADLAAAIDHTARITRWPRATQAVVALGRRALAGDLDDTGTPSLEALCGLAEFSKVTFLRTPHLQPVLRLTQRLLHARAVQRDALDLSALPSALLDALHRPARSGAGIDELVDLLGTACFVVILFFTGFRISEVAGLCVDCLGADTDGPTLRSRILKTAPSADGYITSRTIPPIVACAVAVLLRLGAPHRGDDPHLLVFRPTRGPHPRLIPNSASWALRLRAFDRIAACLLGEPHAPARRWHFSVQQFRRWFALFFLQRFDGPPSALQRHFRHVTDAMIWEYLAERSEASFLLEPEREEQTRAILADTITPPSLPADRPLTTDGGARAPGGSTASGASGDGALALTVATVIRARVLPPHQAARVVARHVAMPRRGVAVHPYGCTLTGGAAPDHGGALPATTGDARRRALIGLLEEAPAEDARSPADLGVLRAERLSQQALVDNRAMPKALRRAAGARVKRLNEIEATLSPALDLAPNRAECQPE